MNDDQTVSDTTFEASMADGHSVRAKHLPGGNFYDDIRIDINASHNGIDEYIRSLAIPNRSHVFKRTLAKTNYYATAILQKAGLLEALCVFGLRRKWFEQFIDYWTVCLAGRPLRGLDFYQLYHEYRKRQQRPAPLEWSTAEQHILNWQDPAHLFSVFHYVRSQAVSPIVPMHIWRHLPHSGKYLEYGCSLAPFYSNAREFSLRPKVNWTLADIPSFAFHYAKYRYRDDAGLEFTTIRNFKDPLPDNRFFDAVFLTTVLEHVDDPVAIVSYLFKKMKPGAVLVFDYIQSDGAGLDTPSALRGRRECLNLIAQRTKVLSGAFVQRGHQPLMVVEFTG